MAVKPKRLDRSESPTKVMLTIGRLERGGAEMRLLELCQTVKERRLPFDIAMYVVSGRKGSLDDAFAGAGVDLIYGKPGISGLWPLAVECRRRSIDVLHSNASLAGGIYALAGWLAGVNRRYAHIRTLGDDETGLKRWLKDTAYRPLLNGFNQKIAGVCEGARNFSRTPREKWLTIYNGMPSMGVGPGAPANEHRVLFIGRFIHAKDPVRMVGIFESMAAHPEAQSPTLQMCGRLEEPLASAVRQSIRAKELDSQISLTGQIDNPLDAICSASVLALPSRREGLPGVVLEALSVGTPVVARDLPGVIEIANQVEGVTLMAADATDRQWADALVAAAGADRFAIAASFAKSPFRFEHHLAMMTALWSGSSLPPLAA